MKKVLLTGHSGFLGSHLANELTKNYEVFGISDKKIKNSAIKQIKKDIRKIKPSDIPQDISHIFHLAALTDTQYCQKFPSICFDVNVMGTQNMLEISRKLDSKFLFLSTSHVYGKPKTLPIKENHSTIPASVYSASKLAAETICQSYASSYGIDCSILRIFSVYGPNSPSHLVTSRIISQILTKNVLHLGNTKAKRDFIFVNDVISAIKHIMKKSKGFNIYNVGNGKSYSILELCNLLQKISGKKISIKAKKSLLRKNEINNIIADSSKLKKLGWKSEFSLYDGLQITYNSYKQKNS